MVEKKEGKKGEHLSENSFLVNKPMSSIGLHVSDKVLAISDKRGTGFSGHLAHYPWPFLP